MPPDPVRTCCEDLFSRAPHRRVFSAKRFLQAAFFVCLLAAAAPTVSFPGLEAGQFQRLERGEILVRVRPGPEPDKGWVEALVLIDAGAGRLWKIMTDCSRAPDFVPGLRACTVIEAGPGWEVIRHRVKWTWFWPEISYTFKADYEKNRRIEFVKTAGDLKEMQGAWRLEPVNGDGKTLVRYGVYLDPGFFVPQWLVHHALKKDLPAVLAALRKEAAAESPNKK